ncbi:DNA polymerase III subunit delta' [Aetokthonos hydrillicola Thurmond2011]|jgi:DNA polymerase-3 subunit delta'|uniref:DNA polymerase III subunit delta n=1 Tax=Aetokthonos hydrillicola Thurmond2011 TaxID=2712845 RepID=A0AAP5M5G1_9CYAN|nr:DNA polymerase III subunit delta' [Aetokthonos hydrillicola]MBO3461881.1 DNA polymerase III subunit delta' [Aetokthonos hydrillicola CCALA 1050]MBW4586777.1 DNA polymerase III subunit delta' [Aetokthonos hydrillicola CCALA 1050]MDR9895866.1 DNA polymerase III subunit delta' [Aetokthonos hydrillicola Thurmond2011]
MDEFKPLIGQEQAVNLLTQAVKTNRIAPAYLFVGPEGVGRGLAAGCFVQLLFSSSQNRVLQGNHPDLLWVQPTYLHQGQRLTPTEAAEKGLKRKAPPVIRLDQIREITEFLGRFPLVASRNVVVLEQAETMAEAAANALLKTLEEPGQATLILIAPSLESILPTLVSRCQRIPFYRLNTAAMTQVLRETGHEEILQHPAVLSLASGSPGQAIAYYKQMQAVPPELLKAVTKVPSSYREALEVAKQIDKAIDTEAQLWLVDYLQQFYWHQSHQPNIINRLEQARKSLLCYAQPRLVWECTFLSFCQ